MNIKDVVLIALFAALIAALSLVPPLPLGVVPVPITLQTLGVMLAGALLGPRRGLLAVLLYTLLWLVGLPILPGGRGGFGVLAGPTGGFLVGMIAGAFVIGSLVDLLLRRGQTALRQILLYLLSCVIGGVLVVYVFGVPWLALVTGMGFAKALAGSLVFLPGDLVKAVVTSVVATRVARAWPMQLK